MTFLSALWLPILVSGILVWIASALTHMVLPFHKSEFKGLQNEDGVLDALREAKPGRYFFPFGTMDQMKEPAFMDKMKGGPNGTVVIWPGPVNMGRNMVLTLFTYLVISVFVAYIGHLAIPAGSEYLFRFRICGAIAFAAYGLGWVPFMIWYRAMACWPNMLDSLIYALLTAGTFAWLWPTK